MGDVKGRSMIDLGVSDAEVLLGMIYGGRLTTPRRRVVIEPLAQLGDGSGLRRDMVYNWDDKEAECYRLYVEEKRNLDEVIAYWEARGFTPR